MERNFPGCARRTLELEAAIVFSILFVSAWLGGGKAADWLSATAVFLSFLCTQAAFDLAEASREASGRPLSNRYRRLYLVKEFFWIVSCIALGNYPLIASTFVFASYPFWRRLLREGVRVPAPSFLPSPAQ